MREQAVLANWLLSEGVDTFDITFGEAFKKLKINDFKVSPSDLETEDSAATEFGINFYPSKKLLAKGIDDYPVINVFIKAGKKSASVDIAHESAGDHLFTVKFVDLLDLADKLSKLDVLSAWKKYVAKVEKKSETKILAEAEVPGDDTKSTTSAKIEYLRKKFSEKGVKETPTNCWTIVYNDICKASFKIKDGKYKMYFYVNGKDMFSSTDYENISDIRAVNLWQYVKSLDDGLLKEISKDMKAATTASPK